MEKSTRSNYATERSKLRGSHGQRPGFTHIISPESLRRWEGFRQTLIPYGTDVKAALPALKEKYGDTYFFYNLYGFTGSEK